MHHWTCFAPLRYKISDFFRSLLEGPLSCFTRPLSHRASRWFFVGMALVMIATSIVGFLPAIVDPATRRAPLTLLAEAHGIVFFMWLLFYVAQSLLIANRRVAAPKARSDLNRAPGRDDSFRLHHDNGHGPARVRFEWRSTRRPSP